MFLIGAAMRHHVDVQGMCTLHPSLDVDLWRPGPISYLCQHMGEQVLCIAQVAQGSTVELALVAGVWVSQPQGYECGRLTLPLVCRGVAKAPQSNVPPPLPGTSPPLAGGKASHRVLDLGELALPSPAAALRRKGLHLVRAAQWSWL